MLKSLGQHVESPCSVKVQGLKELDRERGEGGRGRGREGEKGRGRERRGEGGRQREEVLQNQTHQKEKREKKETRE